MGVTIAEISLITSRRGAGSSLIMLTLPVLVWCDDLGVAEKY